MARNTNQKGRKVEKAHLRLYHADTGCPAWLDLSGNAIKLLIALGRLYKGDNNGTLFLSISSAARLIGVCRNTAARLFRVLEEHGFIVATERGHFHVKGGPATCWRLTWQPAFGRAPTRDFERWQPTLETKSRSQKLGATVPKSERRNGNGRSMVPEIGTATTETSHVSNERPCSKMVTQIVMPGAEAANDEKQGWKQGRNPSGVSVDLLIELRAHTSDYLKRAEVGAQTRLAQAARIPGGTLSKFLSGSNLNRTHFIALQLELARVQREAA